MGVNKVLYGTQTVMDISDSTVTPETLSAGAVAYGANGERMVGMMRACYAYNLLDNSDFRNPVNQRGFVSGTMGSATYSIDRWWLQYSTNLYLNDDCIGLSGSWVLLQYVGIPIKSGQTYTAAVWAKGEVGGEHAFMQFCPNDNIGGADARVYDIGTEWQLLITTWTPSNDYDVGSARFALGINTGTEQTTQTFFKCPVLYEGEYTAETLPEYQPKGYGVELVECQRYYLPVADEKYFTGFYPYAGVPLVNIPAPKMRVNPSVEMHDTQVQSFIGTIWVNSGLANRGYISRTLGNAYQFEVEPASGSIPANSLFLVRGIKALNADL